MSHPFCSILFVTVPLLPIVSHCFPTVFAEFQLLCPFFPLSFTAYPLIFGVLSTVSMDLSESISRVSTFHRKLLGPCQGVRAGDRVQCLMRCTSRSVVALSSYPFCNILCTFRVASGPSCALAPLSSSLSHGESLIAGCRLLDFSHINQLLGSLRFFRGEWSITVRA